jgi:2-polyprenyl-3-methyl-5-hydroxy-6-metoxy-1,4-benzoquinol methylase
MRYDLRSAYDRWHEHLDQDEECNAPWHELIKQFVRVAGHLFHGKRILEIGCGRGGFACWLASQSCAPGEIVAADLSEVAVQKAKELARRRGIMSIKWEIGDIESIAQPDGSFDVVISCETIEHVRDPLRAVCELGRVLNRNGTLLLTTPNYLGTFGLYRLYLRLCGRPYTEEGQPINNLTLLPMTIGWVKQVGLKIKTVDAIGHYLPFPGRPPIEMAFLNNPRMLMRWLGLHSLIIAEKP